MRKINTSFFYLGIKIMIGLCLLALSACKKDAEPQPTNQPACLITRIDYQEIGAFLTLQYDDNKRLVSTYYHRPKSDYFVQEENVNSTIKRDKANQIIKVVSDNGNGTGYTRAFEYDTKGRWSKTITSYTPSGTVDFSLVPEYDTENRVIKVNKTTRDGYKHITTYEYTNGNMTKVTYAQGDNERSNLLEYNLDRETPTPYMEIYKINQQSSGGHSGSKNELKRTIPLKSTISSYDHTYEYNDRGYRTKITTTANSNDGTSTITNVTINTYECN